MGFDVAAGDFGMEQDILASFVAVRISMEETS
jgi:hypothetical protein